MAPEMARQLLTHLFYHPDPAHDMYAFGLLLMELLGIQRPAAHERAMLQAQSLSPVEGARVTQEYAASLADPSSDPQAYSQQVRLSCQQSSTRCPVVHCA